MFIVFCLRLKKVIDFLILCVCVCPVVQHSGSEPAPDDLSGHASVQQEERDCKTYCCYLFLTTRAESAYLPPEAGSPVHAANNWRVLIS